MIRESLAKAYEYDLGSLFQIIFKLNHIEKYDIG